MPPSAEVFGRDVELATVDRFVDSLAGRPALLVIDGEAGIGKTTVWDAGVTHARERLYCVLVARPAEAETKMSYAALGDLLEPVLEQTLTELPEPQRLALEVALLRAKARSAPPEPRTLGIAVVNVLRALGAVSPVLVAVDDLQWLDTASARIVEFALRRLGSLPVGLLATWRIGERRTGAVTLDAAEHVPLGPLDTGALDLMIRARLDIAFPPPTLHRLQTASGGNAFFALEIAQALARQGGELVPGERLPIPDDLNELVARRLRRLPARTRTALVAAAALSRPTRPLVVAAAEDGVTLDKAERAGVITIHGDAIRFSHPLLAAGVYASATESERRKLHRRLAELVDDQEERAGHLALAAGGPEEEIAAVLEDASEVARSRGSPETAADLADQAWRLTPPERIEDIQRRKLAAADSLVHCGDHRRALRLVKEALPVLEPGPLRARGLMILSLLQTRAFDWDESVATIEQALYEVAGDERLRAQLENRLAWTHGVRGHLLEAEPHARIALELAEALGDRVLLAEALGTYAGVEFMRGRGFRRDLMERALALDTAYDHAGVLRHPYWPLRIPLQCSGDLSGARAAIQTLMRIAQERGEESALSALLWALSEIEYEAGHWSAALGHAEEAYALAVRTGQEMQRTHAQEQRAWVQAHFCGTDEPREWAEEMLNSDKEGQRTGAARLLGSIELSLGHAAKAARYLEPALAESRRLGVDDPSVWPHAPDTIEALVGCGELERAETLVDWLEERGRTLDRPWALATGGRCRALLLAAKGDLSRALAMVEEALCAHERTPQQFELARTLLVKGRIARRAKQKRVARVALERALQIFEEIGAALWSKQARDELGRIGGRASGSVLTPTQARIAELVAAGHTNREVADALFVSVKTVEANLSKIYRKLGVSSRRELARALRGDALRVSN